MKKNLILLVIFAAITLLSAQAFNPWPGLRHSAADASGNMHFRFETIPGDFSSYDMYYSTDGAAWVQANITDYSDLTKTASIPYTYGTELRYRMRATSSFMDETFIYMNPAFLTSDSFPPALNQMALINSDPVGDFIDADAPALDLTATHIAVSDTKIYTALSNVSGAFPTYISVSSYNFYMSTIVNPESVTADSVMYAMVYSFNIPGVISSGLYKVGIDSEQMPVFSRLGNIQSQVSGGKLYLACNISDLTNDPSFGTWPNASNLLLSTAVTMRIDIDFATLTPSFLVGDYSDPAFLDFVNYSYEHVMNSLPQIEITNVVANSTGYVFNIEYQDENEDFPLASLISLDNGNVVSFQALSYDYSTPVSYTAFIPVSETWLDATISFSDNMIDFVNLPISSTSNSDPSFVPVKITCQIPNPLRNGINHTIKLSGLKTAPLDVSVFNLKGQKVGTVFEGSNGDTNLNLNFSGKPGGRELGSGMYFLKVTNGNRSTTKKFVLIR